MLATLTDLLPDAAQSGGAIPCFNVFGYEDARAVVSAAESLFLPVILAANRNCVAHMGVSIIGGMLRTIAEQAAVPVCVHLDHCYKEEIVEAALPAGFSSVMFDGSQLPLEENITRTRRIADLAHSQGISVEGEIGSVSYHKGNEDIRHTLTEPEEARIFSAESGVDAVAISIGNVHRLEQPGCDIDYERLQAISELVDKPLVLHGVSGIHEEDLSRLKATRIAKCNVGTSLRMAFGQGLRRVMDENPEEFDRLVMFEQLMPALEAEALSVLRKLAA